jgi:aminomethyltransferase
MLKRTALFSAHQKLGAKLIDFGGWEMPVQYTSITDEHLAVRNAAGIFDISHMGEVTVSGAGAESFLNSVLTNDIRKLASGEGQYTLMCNERGGVIDDLYAYKLSNGVYFLIINASRIEPDVAWLKTQAAKFPGQNELTLTDASHNYSAVAVQGPRVKDFINAAVPGASISAKTDLKLSAVTNRFNTSGIKFSKLENLLESSRAVSARVTRCARKSAIRFTATNWTRTPRRLKLA